MLHYWKVGVNDSDLGKLVHGSKRFDSGALPRLFNGDMFASLRHRPCCYFCVPYGHYIFNAKRFFVPTRQ